MTQAEQYFTKNELCPGPASYDVLGLAALQASRFYEVMDELEPMLALPDDPDFYDGLVERLDTRLQSETGIDGAGINVAVLTRKCPRRKHVAKPLPSNDNLGFDEVAKFVVVGDAELTEVVKVKSPEEMPSDDLPTIVLHGIAHRFVAEWPRRYTQSYRGGLSVPVRIWLAGGEAFVLRRFVPSVDIESPGELDTLPEE